MCPPWPTPKEVVEKISADVREVMSKEAMRERMVGLGGIPSQITAAQFAAMIDADKKRYAKIIAERKITVD